MEQDGWGEEQWEGEGGEGGRKWMEKGAEEWGGRMGRRRGGGGGARDKAAAVSSPRGTPRASPPAHRGPLRMSSRSPPSRSACPRSGAGPTVPSALQASRQAGRAGGRQWGWGRREGRGGWQEGLGGSRRATGKPFQGGSHQALPPRHRAICSPKAPAAQRSPGPFCRRPSGARPAWLPGTLWASDTVPRRRQGSGTCTAVPDQLLPAPPLWVPGAAPRGNTGAPRGGPVARLPEATRLGRPTPALRASDPSSGPRS